MITLRCPHRRARPSGPAFPPHQRSRPLPGLPPRQEGGESSLARRDPSTPQDLIKDTPHTHTLQTPTAQPERPTMTSLRQGPPVDAEVSWTCICRNPLWPLSY